MRGGRWPASPAGGDGFATLAALVAARYAASGRLARGFVAGKLRRDPVHRALLDRAPAGGFGDVLDIGCGRGQMGLLLLQAGVARRVTGLDRAAGKLAQGAAAAGELAFTAARRDLARGEKLPAADTVLMIDVLYQLDAAAQAALLREAARAARRLVFIRTLDPARGARSAATLAVEHAGRLLRGGGRTVNPPPIGRIVEALHLAGFLVEIAPCWRGTPFANVLVAARRPAQPPCGSACARSASSSAGMLSPWRARNAL